jgi:iron(III) transport system substrate-binding protein
MSNPSTSGTAYLLLASHAARLGEDKMWQYYEALDRNLSQVTKSGGAPGRMAASGETPIGIALAYEVEVAKKQGAPIDVIWPSDGVPWTFEGNGLVKGAKNPQNAKRFLDWAVSKSAMASYAEWRGTGITRGDVQASGPKITDLKLIDLDFVKAGDPQYKDRLVKRWLEKFSR